MNEKGTLLHICPYCEKKFAFKAASIGNRAKCPHCGAMLRLFENKTNDICPQLSSSWWIRKPKAIFLQQTIGPLSEIDFAALVHSGQLNSYCEIKSPEFTSNDWILFDPNFVAPVIELASQKKAESARLLRQVEQQTQIKNENTDRLRKYIQHAIADGQISGKEDQTIREFASKAKLDLEEVRRIITTESEQIVRTIVEDALVDGILAPDEEEKINRFSQGLNIHYVATPEQQQLMELSRLAWQLNMSEIAELPRIQATVSLLKNEECLASDSLQWTEVVQLKRPKGISLGGDRFLKESEVGLCYLTTRRVLFESSFESKKVTITSVQRVEAFHDGIFLNRTSGNSIFLRFCNIDAQHFRFALWMKRVLTSIPVQGFLPSQNFIPEQVTDVELFDAVPAERITSPSAPRYTFRVVGDHIGDRAYWIQKLSPGEPLRLVREHNNPYDKNAVLVCNQDGRQLGYLKKEVAMWFADVLDRGKRFTAAVHTVRSDGCLIVGVFQS